MKKLLLLLPLLLFGCGVGVDMETARVMADLDAEVVPRAATSTTIRTFEKYCHNTAGNTGRAVATLKADGYRLLVTTRRERLFGYVHPKRPFVGIIDDPLQPGCLVMVQRDPNIGRAFDRFVNQRNRGAVDAGRSPGLDRTWIVTGGSRDRIYSRRLDGNEEVLLLMVR